MMRSITCTDIFFCFFCTNPTWLSFCTYDPPVRLLGISDLRLYYKARVCLWRSLVIIVLPASRRAYMFYSFFFPTAVAESCHTNHTLARCSLYVSAPSRHFFYRTAGSPTQNSKLSHEKPSLRQVTACVHHVLIGRSTARVEYVATIAAVLHTST